MEEGIVVKLKIFRETISNLTNFFFYWNEMSFNFQDYKEASNKTRSMDRSKGNVLVHIPVHLIPDARSF